MGSRNVRMSRCPFHFTSCTRTGWNVCQWIAVETCGKFGRWYGSPLVSLEIWVSVGSICTIRCRNWEAPLRPCYCDRDLQKARHCANYHWHMIHDAGLFACQATLSCFIHFLFSCPRGLASDLIHFGSYEFDSLWRTRVMLVISDCAVLVTTVIYCTCTYHKGDPLAFQLILPCKTIAMAPGCCGGPFVWKTAKGLARDAGN